MSSVWDGVRVPGDGYTGGCTGGLYRVLPSHRAPRPEGTLTAKRAPEVPCRGTGVGGQGGLAVPFACPCTGARPAPAPTLRARSAPCRDLPGAGPSPRAKGRELRSFPRKLVKTAKCHQKTSKRPTLVPIFQNGSQKSPLDFLRFPILAAFSHKELIGPF